MFVFWTQDGGVRVVNLATVARPWMASTTKRSPTADITSGHFTSPGCERSALQTPSWSTTVALAALTSGSAAAPSGRRPLSGAEEAIA